MPAHLSQFRFAGTDQLVAKLLVLLAFFWKDINVGLRADRFSFLIDAMGQTRFTETSANSSRIELIQSHSAKGASPPASTS